MKKRKILSLILAGAMLFALGGGAMAQTVSVPGTGSITDKQSIIDVNFSADGFLWYTNASLELTPPPSATYEITSQDYYITNNSTDMELEVSLTDYSPVAPGGGLSTMYTQIELNLDDALGDFSGYVDNVTNNWSPTATNLGQDLLNNPTYGTYYERIGENGSGDEVWTYSFTGVYSGTLAGTATEDFTMTLVFSPIFS